MVTPLRAHTSPSTFRYVGVAESHKLLGFGLDGSGRWVLNKSSGYPAVVRREFNLVTLRSGACAWSWWRTIPRESVRSCTYGLDAAVAQGMAFRFHALLWSRSDFKVDMLRSLGSKEHRRQVLTEHIREVIGALGHRPAFYNVINEFVCDIDASRPKCTLPPPSAPPLPINDLEEQETHTNGSKKCGWGPVFKWTKNAIGTLVVDNGADKLGCFYSTFYRTFMKTSPWADGGADDLEDWIDVAFNVTRAELDTQKSTPDRTVARLCANDYQFESNGPSSTTRGKSDRVYAVMSGLVERGVPVDCIGFQGHLSVAHASGVGNFAGWVDGVRSNMRRYERLGLEIHWTEFEAKCQINHHTQHICIHNDASERDRTQAVVYEDHASLCAESAACTTFQFWGLTDADTFCDGSDQTICAGNPFMFEGGETEPLRPKPAYWAVHRVLSRTPLDRSAARTPVIEP